MRTRWAALAALTLLGATASATIVPGVSAEVVQRRGIRAEFDAKLAPRTLPRHGLAPVEVSISTRITTARKAAPRQLRKLVIGVNRVGRLDYRGLPACTMRQVQPASTANALAACGAAKVGEGSFSADVRIPEQSPYPSSGKLIAFNGVERGRHVILAHIYGTDPLPTSLTIPLRIGTARGTFGTTLTAFLPQAAPNVGFVTGMRLNLGRRFSSHGRRRSYLAAGCPAPRGFPGAAFPLAKATYSFAGGVKLSSVISRNCKVAGR